MQVSQSISEIGLENGVLALWSEPRAGQGLKPKFGSCPFPKKPFFAVMLVGVLFAYAALTNGNRVSLQVLLLGPIIAIAIAWPLAIALDRLNRRNIWFYPDRILVTHASDRIVILKADLKKIFIYRAKKSTLYAMEFLSVKGKSTVVALPKEMEVSELLVTLSNIGYSVENL